MSLLSKSNVTLNEIVKLVGELPQDNQQRLLRNLKLEKARALAKKIDRAKKSKVQFTDRQIADIVHNIRKEYVAK